MGEFLCPENPYLPANQPGAPHHLPAYSVERLLDTQFRLLRNDLMGPLLENTQNLLAKANGELTSVAQALFRKHDIL